MFTKLFQLVCSIAIGTISHINQGTEYSESAVKAYSESNHGPDGALFLDPYFKPEIENLNNDKVLDAGCGAAPWSIYAAKQGGEVFAIDIQKKMIKSAKKAIEEARLSNKIKLSQGTVASLPYKENYFDRVISICVACNLPPDAFEKHFSEIQRTIKNGGKVVIGAPNSIDVSFSNGSKSDENMYLHIQQILNQLPDNPDSATISEKLLQLQEVLSATFYLKNNRLELVTNENDLKEGDKIWRKLPNIVIPNHYYSKSFYIKMLKKYNLEVDKIDLPHFNGESDRIAYNKKAPLDAKLGKAYIHHAPFIIYHVKKHHEEPVSLKKSALNMVTVQAKENTTMTN